MNVLLPGGQLDFHTCFYIESSMMFHVRLLWKAQENRAEAAMLVFCYYNENRVDFSHKKVWDSHGSLDHVLNYDCYLHIHADLIKEEQILMQSSGDAPCCKVLYLSVVFPVYFWVHRYLVLCPFPLTHALSISEGMSCLQLDYMFIVSSVLVPDVFSPISWLPSINASSHRISEVFFFFLMNKVPK